MRKGAVGDHDPPGQKARPQPASRTEDYANDPDRLAARFDSILRRLEVVGVEAALLERSTKSHEDRAQEVDWRRALRERGQRGELRRNVATVAEVALAPRPPPPPDIPLPWHRRSHDTD